MAVGCSLCSGIVATVPMVLAGPNLAVAAIFTVGASVIDDENLFVMALAVSGGVVVLRVEERGFVTEAPKVASKLVPLAPKVALSGEVPLRPPVISKFEAFSNCVSAELTRGGIWGSETGALQEVNPLFLKAMWRFLVSQCVDDFVQ
mmetsp:Transcript_15349/g.33201  ORF Transcript_15349/g.33201 Transcript_15349/m.33201 type:complete len:147 (+) Transcript_15349:1226-1666(+)